MGYDPPAVLALKAPLASPTFTGTVTVPDAVGTTDAAQLSDVTDLTAGLAPLASPTFTGTVTAPTPVNPTDVAIKSYVDGQPAGTNSRAVWFSLVHPPINVLGFDTLIGPGGSGTWFGQIYSTSPAVGHYIEWDAYMEGGTWAAAFLGSADVNGGILTLKIDGTTITTFDTYGAATLAVRKTTTGLTVAAASTARRVRLEVTGKNAGSSGYYERFTALAMTRTGP